MDNKGKKLGLIVIGIQKEYTPSDIELNLLSTISDQMGIGLENAAIYEKEKETLKKMIEVDNMKTELISMVSHELRTPLTSIKGFLSHFISGNTGTVNELQNKFLNIMNKESDHLLSLVDNLLEFSRIEKGGLKSKNEKVNIDELVKGVVEAVEPQLTSRRVDLVLDLKCGSSEFMGDDLRIAQVIKNLIGNALKFTKENPRIEISSSIKDGSVEIRIKDNGIGMDGEQLSKIFSKFYQADSSLTRRFGGMGLGLAISREIVEAHKGLIWAESEGKDKGSSFIFTLPMIK
jgi:signal transduction histidine kinase